MDESFLLPAKSSIRIKFKGFKIFLTTIYIASMIAIACLLLAGASFYLTPYKERPHSVEYRALRPAGISGHTYGVIGSAMMILMLTYTLRKRIRVFRNWGMLSRWLNIHIYFGIIGPLLVILHTAFKVQGLVAVSFWSMVAVAASGIFGRYLYLQIPRNIQGDELSIKDLEESNRNYSEQLQKVYNLSEETIRNLEQRESLKLTEGMGAVRMLLTILVHDALRPFRIGHRQSEYAVLKHIPKAERKKIIRITHRKSILARRVLLLNHIQKLFHYWHVIHKPFAIIMYVIMVVHIVIAIWTGYRWIF